MPIFREIPFNPDAAAFQEILRIRPGSRRTREFSALLADAVAVARPKAVYLESSVVRDGDRQLSIGGVTFSSPLLHEELHGTVYPFVATCGSELADFAEGPHRPLYKFWLEHIQVSALNHAIRHMTGFMARTPLASLTPGSLPQWGLEQQASVFALLGGNPAAIGVRLMPNFLMQPLKSVSGIYFHSADGFINCSRCHRRNCPTRRMPARNDGEPACCSPQSDRDSGRS